MGTTYFSLDVMIMASSYTSEAGLVLQHCHLGLELGRARPLRLRNQLGLKKNTSKYAN
jgi:hypothetical protein